MKREIFEWIKTMTIAIIIALMITVIVKPTKVQGFSMEPALSENDYLIINRLVYLWDEPQRGDIVVFKSNQLDEEGDRKLYIKRVVGLPGEEIIISRGKVYINEEQLTEEYIKGNYTHGEIRQEIPENKYFVIGDNRSNSMDSRNEKIGVIDEEAIVGKAFVRLYPFTEIGGID